MKLDRTVDLEIYGFYTVFGFTESSLRTTNNEKRKINRPFKKFSNMRIGLFEVKVELLPGNIEILEKVIDGKFYASAQLGSEYLVRINIYANVDGKYPCNFFRIGVYVDGNDVKYWKRIDTTKASPLSIGTNFLGFKVDSTEIKAFVFAAPNNNLISPGYTSGKFSCGEIKVVIYEAELSNGIFENNTGTTFPIQASTDESQKFYKQASVVTSCEGRTLNAAEKFVPIVRWKNKYSEPMATLILNYHTTEMINLLAMMHSASSNGESKESSSKRDRESVLVNLVDESDEEKERLKREKRSKMAVTVTSAHVEGGGDEDEVVALRMIKEIPMVDLTSTEHGAIDSVVYRECG